MFSNNCLQSVQGTPQEWEKPTLLLLAPLFGKCVRKHNFGNRLSHLLRPPHSHPVFFLFQTCARPNKVSVLAGRPGNGWNTGPFIYLFLLHIYKIIHKHITKNMFSISLLDCCHSTLFCPLHLTPQLCICVSAGCQWYVSEHARSSGGARWHPAAADKEGGEGEWTSEERHHCAHACCWKGNGN